MAFKLTLTDDEIKSAQGGFAPLDAGTYGAVIYDAKQATSKAGNEMYVIDYKITEGPAGIGRTFRSWYVLSGKGLFKLVELNKATDFPYPDKNTPAGEFEFPDADEYLGKEVIINLIQKPFETENDKGEQVTEYRNEVKKVLAYDETKISTGEEEAATADSGQFL